MLLKELKENLVILYNEAGDFNIREIMLKRKRIKFN